MVPMALKHDLLEKGYLPENLPPTFVTTAIGADLAARNGWLTDGRHPVRSSPFNASKRGMTRREFSFVHPSTAHDLAHFVADREAELTQHFALLDFSLSKPVQNPDLDRAVSIASQIAAFAADARSKVSGDALHIAFALEIDVAKLIADLIGGKPACRFGFCRFSGHTSSLHNHAPKEIFSDKLSEFFSSGAWIGKTRCACRSRSWRSAYPAAG